MHKLNLFCFVFLLSAFANVFAGPVTTYQELAAAMRAGDRFVFLLNLQECTGKPNMPIGYFTPSKLMLVPASTSGMERIVTSDLHFTDFTGSPTYEYIKYTFNADDSVMIRTVMYDPLTFKPIGNPHIINCVLGKGISIKTSVVN